nr:MAG TPA_asm: hypothetical protein [Caudoviricetes sp.]
MQLIERVELTSATASIEFSNIPQIFTDLYILVSVRTARNLANDFIDMRFNTDDTDGNYSARVLYGNGSGVSSFTENSYIGDINGDTSTSNTFSSISIYIPNYTSSVAKSSSVETVSENNATAAYQSLVARLWNGTAAINAVRFGFTAAGSNLVAGSSASLYGIKSGSDGVTTVA